MKIWVIIVGILAITTVVYGFNDELRQKDNENLKKCTEEKGGTLDAPTAEAVVCAAKKYGKISTKGALKLVNEKGEFIRDAIMQAAEDVISDADTLEEVRETYSKCHDKADQSGITGRQQALQIATCILPIVPLAIKT